MSWQIGDHTVVRVTAVNFISGERSVGSYQLRLNVSIEAKGIVGGPVDWCIQPTLAEIDLSGASRQHFLTTFRAEGGSVILPGTCEVKFKAELDGRLLAAVEDLREGKDLNMG